MNYFGSPLGLHGWKPKPKTYPDKFRVPESEEHEGRGITPYPQPMDPKLAGPNPKLPTAIPSKNNGKNKRCV